MENLYPGERLDEVNDSLSLIQKTDGLTFGTDALLLASYVTEKGASGLELGSGSGIISLLLLARDKLSEAQALEIQEYYAELTERNARLNSLDSRLKAVKGDVRYYTPTHEFDIVYTNPPYMKTTSGRANDLSAKNIARHEVFANINDFCLTAARSLKYGGKLYVVYRPDRLTDLITAMRDARIEPKRATFVHADSGAKASMVLIEGTLGGGVGLTLTAPLLIYSDKAHKKYSEEM